MPFFFLSPKPCPHPYLCCTLALCRLLLPPVPFSHSLLSSAQPILFDRLHWYALRLVLLSDAAPAVGFFALPRPPPPPPQFHPQTLLLLPLCPSPSPRPSRGQVRSIQPARPPVSPSRAERHQARQPLCARTLLPATRCPLPYGACHRPLAPPAPLGPYRLPRRHPRSAIFVASILMCTILPTHTGTDPYPPWQADPDRTRT